VLKLDDILTSSGKYKDRAVHAECTEEVKKNAQVLCDKVNTLLAACGIKSCVVNSGFRTSDANKGIANAAKKSAHMVGMAVDLADANGSVFKTIYEWCKKDNWVLCKKLGLWLEDKASTPTWCHIDFKVRSDRPECVFKP
jgi:hypothetical protein